MSLTDMLTTGLIVKDPGGSPVHIAQLLTLGEGQGAVPTVHGHGGALNPTHASISRKAQSILWTGTAAHHYIDNFGLTSYDIATSTNDLQVWFKEYLKGGHVKTTGERNAIAAGMAGILSIAAQDGEDPAVVSGVIIPTSSNGTTDPITRTAAQTLPTESFTERVYGMGKITLNTTDITSLVNWSFQTGNALARPNVDSDIFPTHSSNRFSSPTITFGILDVKTFITNFGKSGRMTDLVFYLRHRDQGGDWVADATQTHIAFTATEGIYVLDEFGTAHADDANGEVTIAMVHDGTNILTVDTTAAIA